MNEEPIKLNITMDGSELTVRQGVAMEVFNPVPVKIKGRIHSPVEWLEKCQIIFSAKDACITVCEEQGHISLEYNLSFPWKSTVVGLLHFDPQYADLGVNTAKKWRTHDLATWIRMNRTLFTNTPNLVDLVECLRNVEAKVEEAMQSTSTEKSSARRIMLDKTVKHNLPENFLMKTPIFDGEEAVEFNVEIFYELESHTIILLSPDAKAYEISEKKLIINREILKIMKNSPGIPIIYT